MYMYLKHSAAFVSLTGLLLLAACSGSGETAVISQRPVKPAEPVTMVPSPAAPVPEIPMAEVGRFDTGRMWTFDNPPVAYFEETYGFRADAEWLEKARLGALRFATYCSGSFVSPSGLVMTNHHCARESITKVTRANEHLMEESFYAASLAEERRVPELFVDQLVGIKNVTDEMDSALRNIRDDQERARAQYNKIEEIETRLTTEAKKQDTTLTVEVVSLYDGGLFSAYTYRRYRDVRLVMAPEHSVAAFGGDPDNFTYPRYSLDMSFFRVYAPDGTPMETPNYFKWSAAGANSGEAVFVVGNPASTSRLNTVAQLLFERRYTLPQQLRALDDREQLLSAYIKANPREADTLGIQNEYYSITNSLKALRGELRGLRDENLIAQREAAETRLLEAIESSDSLRAQYGDVVPALRDLQRARESVAPQSAAYVGFESESFNSHVLIRALNAWVYDFFSKRPGIDQSALQPYREQALAVTTWPRAIEEQLIAARLDELVRTYGDADVTVRRILNGRTPEAAAADIAQNTALIDSAGTAKLLEEGFLDSGDPAADVISALGPLYLSYVEQAQNFNAREQNLNARLARARFHVYGTEMPPDATFTLRISDGVVKPYPYNGTLAPAHTTMYGLYDHHYSYAKHWEEWTLPARWLTPPPTFDRATPLNFASTNDTSGGNSGSPMLNKNLEIVGLLFDGNIEGLAASYLFTEETGRAVAVDSRGILEALDEIYDADRIAKELTLGRLFKTEAEADAAN